MSVRGWTSDLALGVRLAVGGGRTSLARFALSSVGIAIAVFVLLVGASVGTMVSEHQERQRADTPSADEPIDGVDPVYYRQGSTEFRGERIDVVYVHAVGENHPVPPGMRDLPGPGEVVASPALAELLSSPEGELLRPRFDGPVVDVMGEEIVPRPGDLRAYVGVDGSIAESSNVIRTYAFGGVAPGGGSMPPQLLLVLLVGGVVLLLPVFIFVASTSRIAGAERDRRLSALRLVGSGSRQVRRIAAAEALVSAVSGLVLGTAAFLVGRQYAASVQFFELRAYPADVVPDPVLAVLVVLAVPGLAVLTALFALRRTIIEPLGVVRRTKPVRRRVWWRLALVVVGVVLLLTGGGASEGTDAWSIAVATGVVLLLVGVPVLLPWLVERVAGRITGGPASWQLAIRRLQLDSGTSARVVGGVAVVLAGAIALQTVLMTAERDLGLAGSTEAREPLFEVTTEETVVNEVAAELAAVPAVRDIYTLRTVTGHPAGSGSSFRDVQYLYVLDCAGVAEFLGVRDCVDGQVFSVANTEPKPVPGTTLTFREYPPYTSDWDPDEYETVGTWTVPERIRRAPDVDTSRIYATLVVTPRALGSVALPDNRNALVHAVVDDPTSDQIERMRNAIAEFGWQTHVFTNNTPQDLGTNQQVFLSIRNSLYAGSVFTLLLAGVSLLVLALEHIRERRRPLAMLAASGVQRAVLARSLLWQVTLPIALGVVVAVLTGVGLAWLIVRMTEEPMAIDWAGVGVLSGAAALLSVLVTAMTLPFLRSATRLSSLRTE